MQIGTKANLKVNMQIEAKTVSNVYKELSKYKRDYSASTWEKIEQAHAQASASFFYGLLGISAGGSYDYYDKQTQQDIKDNVESQRTAQALHDTDNTTVRYNLHNCKKKLAGKIANCIHVRMYISLCKLIKLQFFFFRSPSLVISRLLDKAMFQCRPLRLCTSRKSP